MRGRKKRKILLKIPHSTPTPDHSEEDLDQEKTPMESTETTIPMTDDARILEESRNEKQYSDGRQYYGKETEGNFSCQQRCHDKNCRSEVEIEVEKEAKGETDGNPKKNTTKGVIITEHMKVSTVLTMKALKNVKMYS